MSLHRITLTVALGFAITLTLSCGQHWEDWLNNSDSSSSGGANQSSGGSSVIAGGSCDIKDYKTVKIGNQEWMAQNYNCKVGDSKCYGEDGEISDGYNHRTLSNAEVQANCKKYGRLYRWITALALREDCYKDEDECESLIKSPHQGICPSGWHIPSEDDLLILQEAAGGFKTAGMNLKAKEGWDDCGSSGSGKKYLCEDKFEFSALPGGSGLDWNSPPFGMTFQDNIGETGEWWSVDYKDVGMYNNNEGYIFGPHTPPNFFLYHSIRCVKD
jgi:uncharacterized protein (TIGR02145 family)